MARIYVTEPGTTGGVGAMGMRLLIQALRARGHEITRVKLYRDKAEESAPALFPGILDEGHHDATRLPRPDAWFVSTLYPRQWVDLPDMFRRIGVGALTADRAPSDPLVAIGGQAMIAPEPIADFADVIALGDGEATGVEIAALLEGHSRRLDVMALLDGRRGFYVPSRSPLGTLTRAEASLSSPLVQAVESHDATVVELARGCASKCAFCPIGWAGGTYREAEPEAVRAAIVQLRGKRVNFFAPDYSSVSWVDELEIVAEEHGCKQAGRDARLDAAARHIAHGKGIKTYSFGIEGISERLRAAIGKPLSDDKIVATMAALIGAGVRNIRWYVILALPGEGAEDRSAFDRLCERVREVYRAKLDITFTHLQSVPHTPLQWIDNRYSADALAYHGTVRQRFAEWWKEDKTQWMASGFKGRELHEHDAWLQRASRGAGAYIAALNGSKAKLADGRWREIAARVGLDVDAELGALAEDGVLPWSRVDVGVDRRLVLRAWENYKRRVAPEQAQP